MLKVRISEAFLWGILILILMGIESLLWGGEGNYPYDNSLIYYEPDGSTVVTIPPLSSLPPMGFSRKDIDGVETPEELSSFATRVWWLEIQEGENLKVEVFSSETDEGKVDGQSPLIKWRWGGDIKWRGRWLKSLIVARSSDSSFPEEVRLKISYQDGVSNNNQSSYPIVAVDRIWGEIPIPFRDRAQEGTSGAWVYVIPQNARVREIVAPLVNWRRREGYIAREVVVPQWADGRWVKQELQRIWDSGQIIDYICLIGDISGTIAVPPAEINAGESDYSYGLLEGNDLVPEAAVGRISCSSFGELERIIAKILRYEQNPPRDNPGWMRRGAVIAGSRLSGLSPILASYWARDAMLQAGYGQVDTFWWTMGQEVGRFIERALENGLAIITYRGWSGIEGWTPNQAFRLNNQYLPLAVFLSCNTGDYASPQLSFSEAVLRASGGAVAAIGEATASGRVHINNLLLTALARAIYEEGVVRVGWALNRAKMDMWAVYGDRARGEAEDHIRWVNLMGDPATLFWRGAFQEVTLQASEEIPFSAGEVVVTVRKVGDNTPIIGARVGLYKENELTTAGITDNEGVARIGFSPLRVTPGTASLTVSGDRILPLTRDIRFIRPNQHLLYQMHTFLDDTTFPNRGDGDGIPDPFEIGSLLITFINQGFQAVNPVIIFTLSTDEPGVRILQNRYQHQVRINPGDAVVANFLLEILGNFDSSHPIPMTVEISAGNNRWLNILYLQGTGARWALRSVTLRDEPLPGSEVQLDIALINQGDYDLDSTRARLESLSELAEVVRGVGVYPPLEIGEWSVSDEPFRIWIADRADYEISLPFLLHLITDQGYARNLTFSITVSDRPTNQPSGPDEYGYWAIDDSDQEYNLRPSPEWTEISPYLGGRGSDLGLRDYGEDRDTSVVLTLPFDFRYYGRIYRRITISSNGWLAMGDQSHYRDFRNLPIGSPMGPRGIIAPWWDDLYNPYPRTGVFALYDTSRHRMIIQWQGMRRWVGPDGPGAEETFQVVLLDPAWHPTTTGDGDIIFYYRQITLEARVDAHSTPYPTVGIGSPDGRGGLQYYFWNRYEKGGAPLVSGRAIRFSTAKSHLYGTVRGRVITRQDRNPIPDAVIRSSRGGWTLSDNQGFYSLSTALADLPFTLIISANGFNTLTSEELRVREREEIEREFSLTRPIPLIDLREIRDSVNAGGERRRFVVLRNNGDGELRFNVKVEAHREDRLMSMSSYNGVLNVNKPFSRDEDNDQWERLFTFGASDSTGDHRLSGVTFDGEKFWVSGGANGEDRNYLYRFSREGVLEEAIELSIRGPWGLRDLTYREPFLYGGAGEWIYKFNRQGQLVDSVPSPVVPPQAMTVDPQGFIWIGSQGSPLYRISPQGQVVQTYNHNLQLRGLAWHPNDQEGKCLWIFSLDGENRMRLSRMDTSSAIIESLYDFRGEEGDRAGGCDLTLKWDDHIWVLVALIQNPEGDRVEGWETEVNLSWLTAQPQSGQVAPQEESNIEVRLSAEELNGGEYWGDIVIYHNGAGGTIRVPVRFRVNPLLSAIDDDNLPHSALVNIFPNPSNASLEVRLFLPKSQYGRWSIFDLKGRTIAQGEWGKLDKGYHQFSFSFPQLDSGLYFFRFSWGEGDIVHKWLLLR